MTDPGIRGKVAVVTGASSGLGEQFCRALAEQGASVVLAARRAELLEGIAQEIRESHGVRALAIPTDVSDESQVVRLIERTVAELGTIDILVNNAGMYIYKPITEQTLDDWNQVMTVNLTSAFVASREAARVMIPQRSGCIVNIASTFGLGATTIPEISYYASKGGMVMFTKALAVELGPHDIRVNAIAPGFFPTPMSIDAMRDDELRASVIDPRTALPYLAENEWIRGGLIFLVSDDARYVTGHILAVDGGWTAF